MNLHCVVIQKNNIVILTGVRTSGQSLGVTNDQKDTAEL
jgi:hypothetical protein